MALEDEVDVPLVEPRNFTSTFSAGCAECGTAFSRLSPPINCQQCNKQFCFNCATEVVKLPHINREGQVCDACYFILRDSQSAAMQSVPIRWIDRVGAIFPPEWRVNFQSLLEIAGRMYLPKFIDVVYLVITIIVVGHLGVAQLSAFALARSVMIVTQDPIALAILASVDCAISQILASTQDDKVPVVGVWVQRAVIISVFIGFFIALMWQCSEGIWFLFSIDSEIADLALIYLQCSMLGLLQSLVAGVLTVWMLAQGYELPYTSAGLFGLPVHLLANVVLVYGMRLGLAGAAIATAVSKTFQLVYMISHVMISRLHDRTWAGFTMDCLLPRPLFSVACNAVPLAVSGMGMAFLTQLPLMICAPLGRKDLGPFVCLEYITIIFLQIPAALSSAAQFKITQHLASGDGRRAKGTAWLSVWCTLLWSLCSAIVMIVTAEGLGFLFNHESRTLEQVALLMPLSAVWQIWFSLSTTCFAVLESTRDHSFIVSLSLTTAVIVTLPCSLLLVNLTNVGLCGILWSMVVSQTASAWFAFYKIKDLNWSAEAESSRRYFLNALRSTNRHRTDLQLRSDIDADIVLEDAYLYTFVQNSSVPASFSILDDDFFSDDEAVAEKGNRELTSENRVTVLQASAGGTLPLMLLHYSRAEQSRFRALSKTVLQTSYGQFVSNWLRTKIEQLLLEKDESFNREGYAGAARGSFSDLTDQCDVTSATGQARQEDWPVRLQDVHGSNSGRRAEENPAVGRPDRGFSNEGHISDEVRVTLSLARETLLSNDNHDEVKIRTMQATMSVEYKPPDFIPRLPKPPSGASSTLFSLKDDKDASDVSSFALACASTDHQQYLPAGVLSELETVADPCERHEGSRTPTSSIAATGKTIPQPHSAAADEELCANIGGTAPPHLDSEAMQQSVPALPGFDIDSWGLGDVEGSPTMGGARMGDDDLEALERELELEAGGGFLDSLSSGAAAVPNLVR